MFLHGTDLLWALPSSGRGKFNLFPNLFALLVIPVSCSSLAAFDLTLIGRLSPGRRGEVSVWVRRQGGRPRERGFTVGTNSGRRFLKRQ